MVMITDSLLRTYLDSDGLGLAELVHKGEVAPIELVEAAVMAIEKVNPALNAVIHKLYDMGREAAGAVDRQAPFAGVPYFSRNLRHPGRALPLPTRRSI